MSELKYLINLDNINLIEHILTLPEYDLQRIPELVINSMTSHIIIEKFINKKNKELKKVNE